MSKNQQRNFDLRIEKNGSLFDRILGGVTDTIKNIGGKIKDHAPQILEGVAKGLSSVSLSNRGFSQNSSGYDTSHWQSNDASHSRQNNDTEQRQSISHYKPTHTSRDALRDIERESQQIYRPAYQPHNPMAGITTQQSFSQPYQAMSSNPASSYHAPQNNPRQRADHHQAKQSHPYIQEDRAQINYNLSQAARPVSMAELHARQQQQEAQHHQSEQIEAEETPYAPLQYTPAHKPQSISKALHDKTWLNRRQRLLENIFGGKIYDKTDIRFPYDIENGKKIDDRNIAQMTAVANWILFNEKSSVWDEEQARILETELLLGRGRIPEALQRQLNIARQLNDVLRQNEAVTFQRDDARAFAQGMRILINANTHNGKVNQTQLIEDLKLFTIDASKYELGRISRQAKESNAAYNLFAGPRIGTIGWKEKYWDWNKQYEVDKDGKTKLINQVHHFTFFFTKGLLAQSSAAVLLKKEIANRIDPLNPSDQLLGKLAIDLGREVRTGKTQWQEVPNKIYVALKNY